MKSKIVLCELEKNRRESLRVSLYCAGGYRLLEIQAIEALTASSGIFVPCGAPLTLRVEKLAEFTAALATAVSEAAARAWIASNSLERAGLQMRPKT